MTSSLTRSIFLWTSLVLLADGSWLAAQHGSHGAPAVKTLGPQVGARVPDFTLSDQFGRSRTLRSLMGPKGVVLAFFRSADWCPYCKVQLVELQGRLNEIRQSGMGLAAISYDSVSVLADFASRRSITFPMLSDAGSSVIRAYDILNTTVPATNRQQYGIPFPGTFVVDQNGVVTARFFEAAYQERDTIGSVMVHLGGRSDGAGAKISASHLELTTSVTDQTVSLGTDFSLVLDVTPGRHIHVYAPGVGGYKPVALRIEPQPGLLVRNVQFPKPDDLYFKPLNEHVLVYQERFRIVQALTIDASPQGASALQSTGSLTIKGVLDYQACDETVCFPPQSVPLSWTVGLRPLDSDRLKRP